MLEEGRALGEGYINLNTPLGDEELAKLSVGDWVRLSGVIYGARDAAHRRLAQSILNGEELPFDLRGQVIYYVGPTPARPGRVIGACGPTTSYRMDTYTPVLLEQGLKGMIGKGKRSMAVRRAMQEHRAVYFVAVGGAGALLARRVISCEPVAYADLGPEAIFRLVVKDFPVIVANDIHGRDIYEEGILPYRRGISQGKPEGRGEAALEARPVG